MDEHTFDTVALAADLTAAWLGNSNTRVTAEEVPTFLKLMHESLLGMGTSPSPATEEPAAPDYVPAVTVRKSLSNPAHIISMIDGKPYRTLRRHLSTHDLTSEEYRARYGLKDDYPMVVPTYSEERRAMAKRIGLGRKPGQKPGAKTKAVGTGTRGG